MRIHFRMIYILIGVLLICHPAISDNDSNSTKTRRWGITTKEPLEEEEKDQDNTKTKPQSRLKEHLDEDQPDDQKKNPGRTTGIEGQVQEKIKDEQTTGKDLKNEAAKSQTKSAPGETGVSPPKNTPTATKNQKKQIERIKWENEKQKTKCEAYLKPLKENFLKARHYSIEGQACGTAEYSQKFLKIVENCKQDCPENYLAHKGYTKRIIRNLRWLEKLGAERCTETRSEVESAE